MARRNSRFVNQKVIVGNKSIQASDLTDSARDELGADSDFVKDVVSKLDSNFVNSGFGIDGASIQDSSITQDKFAAGAAAALVFTGLTDEINEDQTVQLIYPGGAINRIVEYTTNTSTNSYTVPATVNGAFVFVQGASGGGGGANQSKSGGGGGGGGGGFFKLSRSELENTNIIQVGSGGNGGGGSYYGNNPGNAGGVTKVATANASLIQVNGGAGGSGRYSGTPTSAAGGTATYDTTNVVKIYTYSGNAGQHNSGVNQTSGGTVGKFPQVEREDIGTGMALFRVTSDSNGIAQQIIDTPGIITNYPGGYGGRTLGPSPGGAIGYPGGPGGSGQIIMYEFN